MQIIIDINENVFTRLFDNGDLCAMDDLFAIAKAVRKGIPLEKIRAEIDSYCSDNRDRNDGLYIAMKIIDKHLKELNA